MILATHTQIMNGILMMVSMPCESGEGNAVLRCGTRGQRGWRFCFILHCPGGGSLSLLLFLVAALLLRFAVANSNLFPPLAMGRDGIGHAGSFHGWRLSFWCVVRNSFLDWGFCLGTLTAVLKCTMHVQGVGWINVVCTRYL
ncbi:hypothetical protein TcCL_NonESM04576 [Trypanosoma cruzi]|uniref:Uncharacterized protein n=1 Tax=Trypanosoma cruzi (strain CL Brener) TaxID=353153 RepID=Q4CZJ3_TRYCC|nr:hypothetical protein Tc00.1047053507773.20 [Trypanosoma cruzi]EAN85691.1 hypothetical protein Tc00.1047053507773.20 [Trypanosoma cruzi]RNC45688.1 hypothetical protein TcCL_NonESM04576 [Trypanosoma cruzi]|eukprot:XP_807542.1 hypothetical protein [Trypanosoma cruzi strain CL Brener]